MTSSVRLKLTAVLVIISLLYCVMVLTMPDTASAIALGYIAFIVSIFIATNWRKKP